MPRREIPFNGGSLKSVTQFLSSQETINYYPEQYTTVNGSKIVLRGAPGLGNSIDLGTNSEIRGHLKVGNFQYFVSAGKFIRASKSDTVYEISNELQAGSGLVGMSWNGSQIIIVDGDVGYIYTIADNTFQKIPDFPGGNTVTFQDGFFFVTTPGTQTVNQSGFNDGLDWPGLRFDAAGWLPDVLVSPFSDNRNLWLFGKETIQIQLNVAASGYAFANRDGTELEMGLDAAQSVASINNGLFWLGNNKDGHGQIFQSTGFQAQRVSPDGLVDIINSYGDTSNAVAFSYLEGNHPMYEISFPTVEKTHVYDSGTGAWWERNSRRKINGKTQKGRHRVQTHQFFNNKHYVGDIENGKVYELSRKFFDEDGTDMEAVRTAIPFENSQNLITINELQVLYGPGVGLVGGDDPMAMISYSYNGGITFGNRHEVNMGKIGKYENIATHHGLGQTRNWALRTETTARVNRDLYGAIADMELDLD